MGVKEERRKCQLAGNQRMMKEIIFDLQLSSEYLLYACTVERRIGDREAKNPTRLIQILRSKCLLSASIAPS